MIPEKPTGPWLVRAAIVLAAVCAGCQVTFSGGGENGSDGGPPADGHADRVDPGGDGTHQDGQLPDGSGPPCTNGSFNCLADGTARYCVGSSWRSLGPCFLGCEEDDKQCRVPSNVETASLGFEDSQLQDLNIPAGTDVRIDTGTGEIHNPESSPPIRAAGEGSVISGIGFYHVDQGPVGSRLGVFVVWNLTVGAGAQVTVSGDNALVILAAGDVDIQGVLDGGAEESAPGPGGFAGGNPDANGLGPCPGQTGSPDSSCPRLCTSGGGGGGFGGAGGTGGIADCYINNGQIYLAGGAGGSACGSSTLSPLSGGSGGAGGTRVSSESTSAPGGGGGGGGAIQISARGDLRIASGGGIAVPGGGGSETVSGGGAGGGAGGAILLEAYMMTVESDAFLTANGGGGGGGD